MKKIWAILDVERNYAIRLMEYLNHKSGIPFDIQVFTDEEKLAEYADAHSIELLLVSEKAYSERMEQLHCAQIMILTEKGRVEMTESHKAVYKYQPADHMVREVMDCYSAERTAVGFESVGIRACRRIAVFNHSDEAMREAAAISLGRLLGDTQKTLYVSLSGGLGLERLSESAWDRNLSDLIYFYRKRKDMLPVRFAGIVRQMEGLDLIPPATAREDLVVLQGEDWIKFLDELMNSSEYETLILDFGTDFRYWRDMLEYCGEIYEPTAENSLAGAAADQLEERILEELGQETFGKIRRVTGNLPNTFGLRNSFDVYALGILGEQLLRYIGAGQNS